MRIFKKNKVFWPKLQRMIGFDEDNNILPDGEKRYKIYIISFISLWYILFLINFLLIPLP
jgi:hypothetical protein